MSRAAVLLGAAVAALVLLASGERFWALAAGCVGLMIAGRLGDRRAPEVGRWFSPELRRVILKRDGGRCAYCGRLVHYESDCPAGGCDTCFEADHVEAWADGGATTLGNGVASCRRCNQSKSDRPVDEFLHDPDGDGVEGWTG